MRFFFPFLLFFHFPFLISLCTPSHMPEAEAETLFIVMDIMSSDQTWRLSYPNPCASTWPGLECKLGPDNHFHVTRLDFGTYPNPTCKNTSTFPHQIFSLPYLQSVFFFNCFTHHPTSISQHGVFNSSLQQLSLRSNPSLVGSIPGEFSRLKSLRILTLSQNHLTERIPVAIFSLTSLVHLDLSFNMLSGAIPFQLGNLKNLVDLDLSYNLLTGTIPVTIGQLGSLQKLDLSSNSLVGRIPDTVEKLHLLSFVALSNNRLRGEFPPGFVKLQSLQYFIMEDNRMNIALPEAFGKLVKLQELRLANSGYSGTIPPTISTLMNLTTLSLQNNRLTGEIPAGFDSLSHIYHLNLSRNLLGGVVPFGASFLKRLGRNLDLSGNPSLCLNSSEVSFTGRVGVGVDVCGTAKNGNLFVKSHAVTEPRMCNSFFVFGAATILHISRQIM